MRETHRTRREMRHGTLVLLKPFFRYSMSRNAYVLRGVGSKMGPVLVETGHTPPGMSAGTH
jgi:hypothetical protein